MITLFLAQRANITTVRLDNVPIDEIRYFINKVHINLRSLDDPEIMRFTHGKSVEMNVLAFNYRREVPALVVQEND